MAEVVVVLLYAEIKKHSTITMQNVYSKNLLKVIFIVLIENGRIKMYHVAFL